jgi:hypothetical protein
MNEFRTLLPRNSRRSSRSAVATPKIVLSGTAMTTITNVSQNACCASGVVTESQAAPIPRSNVR